MTVPARVWDDDDFGPMGQQLQRLQYLYRYVGVAGAERATWFEDIVLRSELFLPSCAKLNDPHEGGAPFEYEASEDEMRAYWEEVADDLGKTPVEKQSHVESIIALSPTSHRDYIRARVESNTAKLGIACFSETPTDTLMWSHYADGHRGVCLRFRAEAMFGPAWGDCTPPIAVSYQVAFPKHNFYRTTWSKRIIAMIATKGTAWAYEREWRIVRIEGPGIVRFDPTALDAVIFGCNMTSDDRDRILELLHGRGVPVHAIRAVKNDGDFTIGLEPK